MSGQLTLAALQEQVQAPLEPATWPMTLQKALQALARFGGGQPAQVLVTPVAATTVVLVSGLWPNALTLADQRLAAPGLVPTIELEVAPRTGAPADKLIRRLIGAYTQVLREPMQLPQTLVPAWPRVRAVFNHLLALQAVCHQLRVPEGPISVTLHGPVAAETQRLLRRGGVRLVQQAMATPWPQAFSRTHTLAPIVIDGQGRARPRADAHQKDDAYRRARTKPLRHFARPAHPAFVTTTALGQPRTVWPQDYTVFDLEFSSGSVKQGWFITEIGAVRVRNGQIVAAFDRFVKIPPHLQLNLQSQRMTGIDAPLLMRYGQAPAAALGDFLGFVGADTLLGFAVRGGDLAVLNRQFDLTPAAGRVLDVAQLTIASGPMPGMPEVGLAKYRDYLGLGALLAHGAIYDAVTTHALYAYMKNQPVAPAAVVTQLQQAMRANLAKGEIK
ncbi:3'-5' exonuclease [Lacticaseibacillus daqingensis]|uniref:3'-5' exonuclease n=1 Tax=Lacticaseibacillus daqingensis TaxID=2486014 RepID=UPI000F797591|nr:3'-5' exonuclease [Lacticaseibacillus daqingensis]